MKKIGLKEAQQRALRESKPKSRVVIAEAMIDPDVLRIYKRGRPPLKLTPEQRAERERQQTLKRVQKLRARKKAKK